MKNAAPQDLFRQTGNICCADDRKPPAARLDCGRFGFDYTLNRKFTTSPSCMTYSLPSLRSKPFAFAFASVPQALRSSKAMTSARMKPRSKSEWILPAACGAFVPFLIVHARHSSAPAVRKEMSPYGVIKTPEKFWLRWKEPCGEPCEPSLFTPDRYPNELDRSVLQFFEPHRLLEYIHDFIIFAPTY